MLWSRRAVLAGATGAMACSHRIGPAPGPTLMDDVGHYAGLGDKITGGPAELATAAWMAERLGALGLAVSSQAITVRSRRSARVGINGAWTWGGLQQGSPDGPGRMITAPLAFPPQPGAIVLAEAPVLLDASWPEAATAAIEAAAPGAVAVIARPAAGQADAPLLYNRALEAPPFSAPLVMVGPSDFVSLRQALGADLSLTFPPPAEAVSSPTLIAQTRGFARRARRVVISTPRTGWFACGAERGPGIALLLALAARAARQDAVGVMLVATTGHEIGHLGMAQFLETTAPPPEDTTLWLHLGACIAAQRDSYATPFPAQQSVLAAPALEPEARAAFTALGYTAFPLAEQSTGEGGEVLRAGYGVVRALAGLHPSLHTPQDTGAAVDPAALAAVGEALWAMVVGA